MTLSELAKKYGSDKGPFDPQQGHGHGYTVHYEREFKRFREGPAALLELGVFQGASLAMWSEWFGREVSIVGVDTDLRSSSLLEGRVRVVQGNCCDAALMAELDAEHGPFDIVVDDASHVPAEQERAFEILWPMLAQGGLYAIEDLHSSYFPDSFLGMEGRPYEGSLVPFLHGLVDDCLGRGKFAKWSGYDAGKPAGRELEVASVRFYRNLCVVEKAATP